MAFMLGALHVNVASTWSAIGGRLKISDAPHFIKMSYQYNGPSKDERIRNNEFCKAVVL